VIWVEVDSLWELLDEENLPCRMCCLERVLGCVLREPGDMLVSVTARSHDPSENRWSWSLPTESAQARIGRVGQRLGWEQCIGSDGRAIWGMTSRRGAVAAAKLMQAAVLVSSGVVAPLMIETYWSLCYDAECSGGGLSEAEIWETAQLLFVESSRV
jgi:hypothetical protein